MLEIPWNGVKMLLEIPWEVSKKMRFLNRGGADINWNSPFDQHGDHATLSTKWRKWQRRFENPMTSLREEDPTVKRALLLTYIGNDTNDIFDTLADTGTDYDTAIQRLTEHFSLTSNTTAPQA